MGDKDTKSSIQEQGAGDNAKASAPKLPPRPPGSLLKIQKRGG